MTDLKAGGESEQMPQSNASSTAFANASPEPSTLGVESAFSSGRSEDEPKANFAAGVRKRIVTSATDQKAAFADRIEEFAESLNRSSEEFAGKQDWIADAIARGGAEVGSLANSLRQADVGELMRQIQLFAQRNPALFIGASLAAGFAVARVGKLVAADLSRDDLPVMPEVGHGQH